RRDRSSDGVQRLGRWRGCACAVRMQISFSPAALSNIVNCKSQRGTRKQAENGREHQRADCGPRVREIRAERGPVLKTLVESCAVSRSMISLFNKVGAPANPLSAGHSGKPG